MLSYNVKMDTFKELLNDEFYRLEGLRMRYDIKVNEIAEALNISSSNVVLLRSKLKNGGLNTRLGTFIKYANGIKKVMENKRLDVKKEFGKNYEFITMKPSDHNFSKIKTKASTIEQAIVKRRKVLTRRELAVQLHICGLKDTVKYEKSWIKDVSKMTFRSMYLYAYAIGMEKMLVKL